MTSSTKLRSLVASRLSVWNRRCIGRDGVSKDAREFPAGDGRTRQIFSDEGGGVVYPQLTMDPDLDFSTIAHELPVGEQSSCAGIDKAFVPLEVRRMAEGSPFLQISW